jgi:pyruvate ferredoxin oxidoreductase alpha subunit
MMVKQQIEARDGAKAVAEAMRQIDPDVVAAYPITPQTEVVQTFSAYVADGLVGTEFVAVESEHAAMSACVGASSAGGRVMTATAANGLALMWEVLYIAASMRLPIVMTCVNRALSAPLNIHCDHSDSMGARDTGWVQLFAENPQEAYDNTIQAVRIAEHLDLRLPVMSMQDGFITGHGVERIALLPDEEVKRFVRPFQTTYSILDIDNPLTMGAWDFYNYYFEHKRQQTDALSRALPIIEAVGKEYGELTGRAYGLFDTLGMEDAEMAIVVLSSTAGTARSVVRQARAQGIKVGLVKPRVFRPFPHTQFVEILGNCRAVAVMDRSISFGSMDGAGPLFLELAAALFAHDHCNVKMVDYIFGLGGRDILPGHIEQVIQDLQTIVHTGDRGDLVRYLGLRE